MTKLGGNLRQNSFERFEHVPTAYKLRSVDTNELIQIRLSCYGFSEYIVSDGSISVKAALVVLISWNTIALTYDAVSNYKNFKEGVSEIVADVENLIDNYAPEVFSSLEPQDEDRHQKAPKVDVAILRGEEFEFGIRSGVESSKY